VIVRDANEGADIIMVKPAMLYLDIISDAAELMPNHLTSQWRVHDDYAGARASVGHPDSYEPSC